MWNGFCEPYVQSKAMDTFQNELCVFTISDTKYVIAQKRTKLCIKHTCDTTTITCNCQSQKTLRAVGMSTKQELNKIEYYA